MTDTPTDTPEETLAALRARTEALERQLAAVQQEAEARLIGAELRAQAMRAGIIDLDGLKLLETTALRVNERGEVDGAAEAVAALKRSKPWLFTAATSSSTASPPPPQTPRTKRAQEMSDAEYRAARAELLRRR
ncbi:MAG TPA: hypothetical protein VJY39_17040 [Acidisphaera sp.]|nr:hypothetical protein [Acidisphaera sp.]